MSAALAARPAAAADRAARPVPGTAPQERAQDPPAVQRRAREQVERREQDIHRSQPAQRGHRDSRAARAGSVAMSGWFQVWLPIA
jgi:hypothetical protein